MANWRRITGAVGLVAGASAAGAGASSPRNGSR